MDPLDPHAVAGAAPPPPPPPAPPAPGTTPEQDEASGPRVVRTDEGAEDGLAKCLRCGATEISLNPANGNLRCSYCRFEWQSGNALETLDLNGAIGELTGVVVGSGTADIVPSTDEVLTFRCTACGAEVVIDTRTGTQARCHWCRNTLSMNQQIPNGAVPDMVLPFSMTKAAAVQSIADFVTKRTFFAHPRFKEEFNPENVMGVYLPYMVVDINAHARLTGQGEHQTRSYTVKSGDTEKRVYDADVYDVVREFDIHIDDLTVESSRERLNQSTSQNSNNIINSIMPFDVENSVRYDSNYLSGFASERRDSNIDQLAPVATVQAEDIARHKANETLAFYDRGVRWDAEQVEVVGQRWVSAYLPVWLYSYHETKPNGRSFLHYVAVNARTGETMGSVPVNQRRLLLVAGAVQVVGTVLFALITLVGG
ncbi:TFIIB-type zinc ribbon-containing protein [Actinotalea sp. K2]|uniref:TFIIB-type zinc ribbon-containing protein n=1 Tax=Actinotalea sp. K2 TaxID=2939438 RepID=UPI00201802C9|nr:TFIIB-type zinc ribbon-containing protein [Actinotalea sp. K2]MCL3862500.1 TFIIB-type zinc ribbon-containing protein [Actinotalea sp. K2]